MALQKYGSNAITAMETIRELKAFNIDQMSLRPEIKTYYCDIVDAVRPKRKIKNIEEIVPHEDVEVVTNKNEDMTISKNE